MKNLIILSLVVLSSCSPKISQIEKKISQSHIINGNEIKESDALAFSIVGVFNSKINSICSGTIIAQNIVLTAAHCIPKNPQDLKIVFSTNVDDIINAREQDILHDYMLPVLTTKVSQKWNPSNDKIEIDTGDIAIVKFKGDMPAGYHPIEFLKDPSIIKIGLPVTMAGYGVSNVDMEEINPLKYKKIDQAIEDGEVYCTGEPKNNYGTCYQIEQSGDGLLRMTSAPISFIHETEIRLNEKNAGTCNGDSGGPAFIMKDNKYYLFGVTSRGSELCNDVGVYTNALYYKKWIDDTIKTL